MRSSQRYLIFYQNALTEHDKNYYGYKVLKMLLSFFKSHKKNDDNDKSIQFYSQFVKKGDLCFDIGANMGNRTMRFVKIGCKVVCVEPQEECINCLSKEFASNPNVVIINKAIGDYEGFAEISICKTALTISTLSTKWKNTGRFSKTHKWDEVRRVPITTLDSLIKLYGVPKFCKIDVEGYELPVLRGLSTAIPYISFEFTREFFSDALLVMEYCLTIGNAFFNCSIGEAQELYFPKWLDMNALSTQIAKIDDLSLWGDIYVKFS